MKKLYFYSILCLLLCLGGIATAEVKVFYLPDNGYLRVEGQLAMEPSSAPLSFLVFPNAQITEFWVEGLENYQIERGAQGTVVTFSVGTLAHSPILDLSYEGFLSLKGNQITLDRDTLWFPEFSFPVRPPTFTAELPQEWEINMVQRLHSEVKSTSWLRAILSLLSSVRSTCLKNAYLRNTYLRITYLWSNSHR